MQFKSVKVPKLSATIVGQIEDMILDGVLKPGDRLPAERDLAQQLDVSRASLREALGVLQARGLLQARRGGGTYVRDVAADTVTEPLVHLLKKRPDAVGDFLEVRSVLEEMAAQFAAKRANDVDREIIALRFRALETTYDTPKLTGNSDADLAFHMAIADASHNVALVHVMRGLFNLLHVTIADNLDRIFAEAGGMEVIRRQHRELYDAVMAGDADAARRKARTHLDFVVSTLRGSADETLRQERSRRRLENIDD